MAEMVVAEKAVVAAAVLLIIRARRRFANVVADMVPEVPALEESVVLVVVLGHGVVDVRGALEGGVGEGHHVVLRGGDGLAGDVEVVQVVRDGLGVREVEVGGALEPRGLEGGGRPAKVDIEVLVDLVGRGCLGALDEVARQRALCPLDNVCAIATRGLGCCGGGDVRGWKLDVQVVGDPVLDFRLLDKGNLSGRAARLKLARLVLAHLEQRVGGGSECGRGVGQHLGGRVLGVGPQLVLTKSDVRGDRAEQQRGVPGGGVQADGGRHRECPGHQCHVGLDGRLGQNTAGRHADGEVQCAKGRASTQQDHVALLLSALAVEHGAAKHIVPDSPRQLRGESDGREGPEEDLRSECCHLPLLLTELEAAPLSLGDSGGGVGHGRAGSATSVLGDRAVEGVGRHVDVQDGQRVAGAGLEQRVNLGPGGQVHHAEGATEHGGLDVRVGRHCGCGGGVRRLGGGSEVRVLVVEQGVGARDQRLWRGGHSSGSSGQRLHGDPHGNVPGLRLEDNASLPAPILCGLAGAQRGGGGPVVGDNLDHVGAVGAGHLVARELDAVLGVELHAEVAGGNLGEDKGRLELRLALLERRVGVVVTQGRRLADVAQRHREGRAVANFLGLDVAVAGRHSQVADGEICVQDLERHDVELLLRVVDGGRVGQSAANNGTSAVAGSQLGQETLDVVLSSGVAAEVRTKQQQGQVRMLVAAVAELLKCVKHKRRSGRV
mmetsp:Transcript_25424/g.58606  ORF Transcript_25424/g.58606 Transcript_25424/m.58606 type:complete len:719 (+) Transcript_25424:626-2782(+)